MSEQSTSPEIHDRQQADRRARACGTVLPALMWSGYASAAFALLAFTVYCSQLRQGVRMQLEELTTKHTALRELDERWTSAREQSGRDRTAIVELMRMVREPAEIPDFGGDRVVFSSPDFNALRFFVPQGNHVLQIKTRWVQGTTSFASRPPALDSSSQEDVLGEEKWEIPLLPNSGYWLELDDVWTGPLLNWTLAGNHPDFALQRGALPLQQYTVASYMQGNRDGVKFPNEVRNVYLLAQQYTEEYASGLNLMSSKILGRLADLSQSEGQIEISIEVQLHSDTPPSVPASGVDVLLMNKPQQIAPYTGRGKYDLIVPY